VTDMHEQLIDILASDRRARMLREAEAYRLLIDNANLTFGPSPIVRARRALARLLAELSERIEPCHERFLAGG
jgi:hypothetical protein